MTRDAALLTDGAERGRTAYQPRPNTAAGTREPPMKAIAPAAAAAPHVARILATQEVRDRVHTVVPAYECGLVRPGAG